MSTLMLADILKQVSLNNRKLPENNLPGIEKKPRRIVSDASSRSETLEIVDIRTENLGTNVQKNIALFVGNLAEEITSERLTEMFKVYKSFISAKVCTNADDNRSLGHGYINFGNKEDAERATEDFNYNKIMGKEIRIMPSIRDSVYRKNFGTNIFFSNLPLQKEKLTHRMFYDIFRKYGKVLSVKLDSSKNIGFVYFEDDTIARNVIKEFNNKEFLGNIISCGLHFDKELRKKPNFDKQISKLDDDIIIEKEKEIFDSNKVEIKIDKDKVAIIQPNGIFIKNLPLDTNNNEILTIFSEVGPIKSVFLSPLNESREYLWAFVTYKDKASVEKAISLFNGKAIGNRNVFVTHAYSKYNIPTPKPILFLSNLSPICDRKFLKQIMNQLSVKPEDIKVHQSENPEHVTSTGTIQFKTQDDLDKAKKFLNNKLVSGSIIYATTRKSKKNQEQTNYREFCQILPNSPFTYKNYGDYCSTNIHDPSTHDKIHFMHAKKLKNYEVQTNKLPYNGCQDKKATQLFKNGRGAIPAKELLLQQIKDKIDNLKYPFATRPENLKSLADYIFIVFWNRNGQSLSQFLLLQNSSKEYAEMLKHQIETAASTLGFGR